MGYQKKINQQSKLRRSNRVEIHDDARERQNSYSQIKF